MPRIYLGMGSNIRREYHIPAGLTALSDQFGAIQYSSVFDTASVGFEGDNFFNLIVSFDTELSVIAVDDRLTQIENRYQRDRSVTTKFCSRTLDLDLLLYGNEVISTDVLQIPRDDVYQHVYVLAPLVALNPTLKDPVSGRLFSEILAECEQRQNTQVRLSNFDPFPEAIASQI